MTAKELIDILSKYPPNTEVLIRGDANWNSLNEEEVEFRVVYLIQNSGFNASNIPYKNWSATPNDMSWTYKSGLVETSSTISKEMAILLG